MFDRVWFENLDKTLREMGVDSDAQSFDEIKDNLSHPKKNTPSEFASNCAYVILAGGFSQKTAKKIYSKIMNFIFENGASPQDLLKMFANKNKINAICKIWNNKENLCEKYYSVKTDDEKIAFLSTLPHIGKITANHLARNLGVDVVKYDIWIQRLGVLYAGNPALYDKIDNGHLCSDIKCACDNMFTHLVDETGLPRGYIDVVLWKSCQQGLIKL
ncbi:MAG: hypothetical protein MJ170_00985 [Alphaproteobacteria bacterium]|nr:hypothetical protein [Alphaproteobacteria bacterium]